MCTTGWTNQLLWNTLERDVPALGSALSEWARGRGIVLDEDRGA